MQKHLEAHEVGSASLEPCPPGCPENPDLMAERLVDHLVDHEIVWVIVDNPVDLEEADLEDFHVFLGRDTWDGEEYFVFRGYVPHEECADFAVPAAWITRLEGFGGILYCTAWQQGINPTSRVGDRAHVDPNEQVPIDICPIHEL